MEFVAQHLAGLRVGDADAILRVEQQQRHWGGGEEHIERHLEHLEVAHILPLPRKLRLHALPCADVTHDEDLHHAGRACDGPQIDLHGEELTARPDALHLDNIPAAPRQNSRRAGHSRLQVVRTQQRRDAQPLGAPHRLPEHGARPRVELQHQPRRICKNQRIWRVLEQRLGPRILRNPEHELRTLLAQPGERLRHKLRAGESEGTDHLDHAEHLLAGCDGKAHAGP